MQCCRPRRAAGPDVWDRGRVVPDEPRPEGQGVPGVQVPDDASALFRDVEALERERRATRRRTRTGRLLGGGRPGRPVSGRLVVLALAVVAAFATLPVLLHPRFSAPAPAQPLAAPSVAPGTVGGLLPDAALLTPAGTTTTRALPRPGALVLTPVPCETACEQVVGEVVGQLLQATRDVRLLTPGPADPAGRLATQLRGGPARGLITSGVDVQGVLAPAYGAVGVTVVTVAADGVVLDVVRDVAVGRRLDAEVGRLLSSSPPPVD